MSTRYELAIVPGTARLGLEAFAARAGLHPDLVRRLVALGLLQASARSGSELWFRDSKLRAVARIRRLKACLPLNYAALGLILDLLDRIEELERQQQRSAQVRTNQRWT